MAELQTGSGRMMELQTGSGRMAESGTDRKRQDAASTYFAGKTGKFGGRKCPTGRKWRENRGSAEDFPDFRVFFDEFMGRKVSVADLPYHRVRVSC
jgi:hypothetical protein